MFTSNLAFNGGDTPMPFVTIAVCAAAMALATRRAPEPSGVTGSAPEADPPTLMGTVSVSPQPS